ncbi:hypothetical protein HD806DRAFT_490745 [Xylariaceae sp. AK1471]|nr:hypothetical protein HD806DRAFT_490745 [Xylariaceae sp. AK1471]
MESTRIHNYYHRECALDEDIPGTYMQFSGSGSSGIQSLSGSRSNAQHSPPPPLPMKRSHHKQGKYVPGIAEFTHANTFDDTTEFKFSRNPLG